jgi:hypothetical protein
MILMFRGYSFFIGGHSWKTEDALLWLEDGLGEAIVKPQNKGGHFAPRWRMLLLLLLNFIG